VPYRGFEPRHETGLSCSPLPIGILGRGASRWIRTSTVADFKFAASADWATEAFGLVSGSRTHSDRSKKSNTVHRPRALVASSGVEPLTRRLEDASPESIGEAKLERTMRVELTHASLATMPRTMRVRISGSFEWNQTTGLRVISSALYH
jgi:hypothetical protein